MESEKSCFGRCIEMRVCSVETDALAHEGGARRDVQRPRSISNKIVLHTALKHLL